MGKNSDIQDKVASFKVDHRTLKEGIYLRSQKGVTRSWDIRFVSPSAKAPMSAGAVHALEHILAYELRMDEVIGDRVVALCPMGCLTGFYLITEECTEEEVKGAVVRTLERCFPIIGKEDIPAMNEVQCGNPGLCSVEGANYAVRYFLNKIG